MASGGPRVPSKPAAVSGPGRFSARTDTGPADVVAPGGSYGSRQQLEAQQAAAPVPTGGNTPADVGPPGTVGGDVDVFGPTQRPGEPATAGMIGVEPDQPIPDSKAVLRAIYQRYPSPWIAALLHE